MENESFVYTACPGWGDHDYCALKTIVKDGKIVRTEKVNYSEPERCDGHICQKGLTAGRQPYNPTRLLKPLKRVGARGEGKWEEISWDQALDEIGEKLVSIRDEYGPKSVVMWCLAAGVPPAAGLGTLMAQRFGGLWGVTDPLMSFGLDNGPFYTNFYNFGDCFLYMLIDPVNFQSSNYIIIWGANPIENQMRIAQNLVRARMNGAKVVDIGLVFDGSAGWADEFIGVQAGSDSTIALAMANIIIKNDWHDVDFLIEHSIAAYLVRTDTGQLLRDIEGNYFVWDEAAIVTGNYYEWDKPLGSAVPVAPNKGTIRAVKPALSGIYEIDGVAVRPAFQILTEHLKPYTPKFAEAISGVPSETIERIAEEYAKAENAYLVGAIGLRYANSGETYRAFHLLGTITGNLGRPGAGVTAELIPTCYPIALNDAAITRPFGAEGSKVNCVKMPDFFEQVKQDDCPYKAFICPAGNPVHQFANRSRWESFFAKLDLVVDIDVWMTDTGELADYVLPDCMPFEREEIIVAAQYNHVVLQEAAIEPQGDARPPVWYWTELAKRVGLGEYYDKTTEEWLDLRLQTDYPLIAGLEPKLTYERLKQEKMVRTLAPAEPKFDPFANMTFSTPTGRIEFYAERLASVGVALPVYKQPLEVPVPLLQVDEKHPYQLFTGRQRFFMQSMFTDDPITVGLSGGEPATRMNPADALKEDLKDGDKVEVYNDRGHVVTKLCLDEAVPPGTIHVWFGWRRRQFEEGTYAEMLIPLSDISTVDEVALKWWDDWVAQGGVCDTVVDVAASLVGAWDTLWDCACNIRKYEAGKEN